MNRAALRIVEASEAEPTKPMSPDVESLLVSRTQAAALLGGISRPTVVSLIRAGKLAELSIGRRKFVVRASVDRFVDGKAP